MASELELRAGAELEPRCDSDETPYHSTVIAWGTGSLSLIAGDQDLVPLLRQASNEELAPLVEYIVKKGGITAQLRHTRNYKLNFPKGNPRAYADNIAAEIQNFGGNSIFTHVFRKGCGKKYRKVLKEVAKRCGVSAGLWASTAEVEDSRAMRAWSKAWQPSRGRLDGRLTPCSAAQLFLAQHTG